MASISHPLLVLLGISSLATPAAAAAAPPGAAGQRRRPGGAAPLVVGDSVALVQQRAHLEPQSASLAAILTETFRRDPDAREDVVGKIVSKVGEERLHQFWAKVLEVGRSPNISRPHRGLLMVQEAAKATGAAQGNPLTDWIWDMKAYLEQGKSEPAACWLSRAAVLTDIGDLTIAIAYPAGVTCSKPSLCVASAFDILRALVYTIRDIMAARWSYCAEKVDAGKLCAASALGMAGEVQGVIHSSISLGYKCDKNSYASTDSSGKVFGRSARDVMCTWDITRAASYAIAGIYRAIYWFYLGTSEAAYVNDEGKILKKKHGAEEIGQSGPAYGLMALGGFAWVTNAVIASAANCPDDSGTSGSSGSACGKEAAELSAYAFQALGYVQNYRDYCWNVYEKNEIRRQAGNEAEFRRMVKAQWEMMRRYVPKEISPEDVKVVIDEFFSDEASAILVSEMQKEVSTQRQRNRPSMSVDEMNDVLDSVERAIDTALAPHLNARLSVGGRLSVYKPPEHRPSITGNTRRSVIHNHLAPHVHHVSQGSDLLAPPTVHDPNKPFRSIGGIKIETPSLENTNDQQGLPVIPEITEHVESSSNKLAPVMHEVLDDPQKLSTKLKKPEVIHEIIDDPVTIEKTGSKLKVMHEVNENELPQPIQKSASKLKTPVLLPESTLVHSNVGSNRETLRTGNEPPPPLPMSPELEVTPLTKAKSLKTIGGYDVSDGTFKNAVDMSGTVVEHPQHNSNDDEILDKDHETSV